MTMMSGRGICAIPSCWTAMSSGPGTSPRHLWCWSVYFGLPRGPHALTQGSFLGGVSTQRPMRSPIQGPFSDPWQIPLSTAMLHDILWSYLVFQVMSVSDVLFIFMPSGFRFLSLVSPPSLHHVVAHRQSSFLFPAALSDVLVVRACSSRQRSAHWPAGSEQQARS